LKIIFNLLIFKEIKMEKSVERGNVLASACPSRQILQHLTSRWGALDNTVPPQVDYTLTEFGSQASNKMFELVDWLETNLDGILAKKQAANA